MKKLATNSAKLLDHGKVNVQMVFNLYYILMFCITFIKTSNSAYRWREKKCFLKFVYR